METIESKNTFTIFKLSMYITGVVGSVDPLFVDLPSEPDPHEPV